ncbi:S-layer family protein [Leptolyngbya cf. ectocarpi LEGE 11479]|uniref:S-layer family protein n=1 Tax=Leptolyngbya cf. ectocarpi LEGE 11479 TaxID=1828722 RepID=A0A928ZWG1_LEPEC|nr:S-layer family protein [Leptolyngbya ectocarpi]MBE9068726.1 S-layer family protein [Leptolyngbya cf. ectocarpi LEGE 11479]
MFVSPASTNAEIIADTTLPTNTVVLSGGCTTCEIVGGTVRGRNLFHSFATFSVDDEAFFNNAATVENIFSRVTGRTVSDINGLIRTNGAANLFLINPNGITFGSDAALNIGGSFIASTANRIGFEDNTYFDASLPATVELLSISSPIGLQFGQTPASLNNSSQLFLDGPTGRTLALIGGDVNIPGGGLFAPAGNIELSSVGAQSNVELIAAGEGWRFNYDNVNTYQDILLSDFAELNTSGAGAGAINIQGQNITFASGSFLQSLTLGADDGNDVTIAASKVLLLTGDLTALEVASVDSGAASDIVLNADLLKIDKGAYISAPGVVGQASDITITANQIELSDVDSDGIPGGIFAEVFADYDKALRGGNITIETNHLMIQDGAQISLATFGAASSGNLIVNASQSVEIGPDPIDVDDSGTGLFNQVGRAATGNAGEISVTTGRLFLRDGGKIESSTLGSGNGGLINIEATEIEGRGRTADGRIPSGIVARVGEGEQSIGDAGAINIETQRLTLLNGAQISTAGRNEGNGGPLTVNASDYIVLNGIFPVGDLDRNSSGLFVSAEPGATSDVGILTATTDTLIVENGAKISADNLGSGRGSTATINARELIIRDGGRVGAGSLVIPGVVASRLGPGGTLIINASERVEVSGGESQLFTRAEGAGPAGNLVINETPGGDLVVIVRADAEISASTDSSTGGNIIFNDPDAVLLRTGGRLTAEAGLSQGFGDGGNITLAMPDGFLISVADEDSDIVANAFAGSGGNINITAQGIFNLVERPAIDGNGTNDIDASSQFGESGTVVLNNLDLDPTQNLIELPTDTTAPTVAQRCLADSEGQSAFVVTGQGGAPPTPRDVVRNESAGLIDIGGDLPISQLEHQNSTITATANDTFVAPSPPLIEAQSWQRDHDGHVVLIAQTPNPSATAQYLAVCPQVRG